MITAYQTSRLADVTVVRVTSDLAGGTVYYHWFAEGDYLGRTTEPERVIQLDAGEQLRIDCLDTLDPDYDALASAPAGYPARKTLAWVRSLDGSTVEYRIDQRQDAGEWEEIGRVPAEPGRWEYRHLTDRLVDLTEYAWRIVPLDAVGNAGTPVELGRELVVRRPDAPSFTVALGGDRTLTLT